MVNTQIDINKINEIAVNAGLEIMKVYNVGDFETVSKKDNSPLTIADRKSHTTIKNSLISLYPEIPVISEEDNFIDYEERKSWNLFWLVDPLDGTKEFISRNGEFTVNIALIENKTPVAGVIYVPVKNELYYADNKGTFRLDDSNLTELHVSEQENEITVVKSRSHSSEDEDFFYSRFDVRHTISAGSSLKFCLVAEGRASIYYRSGPTWEWDTAAGHALVKYAGGHVRDMLRGTFTYNKESLLNNAFCASSFEIL